MGAIRDFLDSVGRTKTGYAGTNIPGPPPVAPPDLTPTQITDALRDVLKKNIGFGGGDGTFSSTGTSKAGSEQTAAEKYAADKAAFDETLRKYQLDRRAYEQYQGDVNARLRSFNPYADAQYRIMPTNTGAPVPTPTAPAAPTKLNAPTYGAIPITMSTPTDQGAAYKQMRDFGYTDADIRGATSKITGSPTDQKWADILSAGYSQYAPAVQGAYQQLGRSGFGGGAEQIDTPGYSYWLNQLSSGAVRPEDLNQAVLTAGRPSNYGEIQNIYQQYFNRTPDPSGTQYWGQSGLTGSALQNAIIAGAQGPDLAYYQQNFGGGTQQPINQVPDPYYAGGPGEGGGAARGGYISKYAEGGRVRTHYQTGGRADEGNLDELDAFYRDPRNFTRPQSAPIRRSPAASPVMSPSDPGYLDRIVSQPIGANPRSERNILDPNTSYGRMYPANAPRRAPPENLMPIEGVGAGAEITGDAPRRLEGLMPIEGTGEGMPIVAAVPTAEPTGSTPGAPTPAGGGSLQDMLARYMRASTSGGSELADARRRYQAESDAFYGLIRQMAERGESPTSRSEMYFRLASAFGSPTRTGSMGETLSKVGEQMSEYTKGRRADEAERRNLMVQAQQARMAGAREDLTTTRALAAQEATERRTLNTALLQEYIRSGQPQSNAGRMARDAGLTPGTQAFQDFVTRHAELDVQRAQQLIQAQNENLTLRREAADRLSATEIKLADETSQNISSARDNAILLREAIRLNPNASPSNLTEGVITDLRRRLGSTDPLVVNTADIRNILSRLTLGSLKETFPGAISNDERRALEAVSGVTAASREERARIMQRASDALERIVERNETQLRRIRSGAFGRIEREQGGTQ